MELRDCVMEGVAAQMSYMGRVPIWYSPMSSHVVGVRGTFGGVSSGASADATLKKKKTHRTARRFRASRRHDPPRFARVSGFHVPCRPACREEKKKDRREATVRDGAPESNRMRAHVRAAWACVALRDSSPSPVARYPPVPLSSVRSGLEPQWTERRLPDRRPSASHVASRDAGRRHGAACRVAPSRPRIEHKTPWRRPRGLM